MPTRRRDDGTAGQSWSARAGADARPKIPGAPAFIICLSLIATEASLAFVKPTKDSCHHGGIGALISNGFHWTRTRDPNLPTTLSGHPCHRARPSWRTCTRKCINLILLELGYQRHAAIARPDKEQSLTNFNQV